MKGRASRDSGACGPESGSLTVGSTERIRHQRTKRLQPSYPFVRGQEELCDLLTVDERLTSLMIDRMCGKIGRFYASDEESFDMASGRRVDH